MNREDLDAKRIYQQARPVASGVPFNSSTGGAATTGKEISSTLQDGDGNVRRLWIPGIDPWGVEGFYFGNEPLPEIIS